MAFICSFAPSLNAYLFYLFTFGWSALKQIPDIMLFHL